MSLDPRQGLKPHQIMTLWRDEIAKDAGEGMALAAMGVKYGLSPWTIRDFCKREGIFKLAAPTGFERMPGGRRVRHSGGPVKVKPAVPLLSGDVATAQKHLQSRGHYVYAATVKGGEAGKIFFNNRQVSAAELIELAEKYK
jgi:hypothetical protein